MGNKYAELIKKEMTNRGIIVDDISDAIELVKDLMYYMLQETRENHPHATHSMSQMNDAHFQLNMLNDWIREELENE